MIQQALSIVHSMLLQVQAQTPPDKTDVTLLIAIVSALSLIATTGMTAYVTIQTRKKPSGDTVASVQSQFQDRIMKQLDSEKQSREEDAKATVAAATEALERYRAIEQEMIQWRNAYFDTRQATTNRIDYLSQQQDFMETWQDEANDWMDAMMQAYNGINIPNKPLVPVRPPRKAPKPPAALPPQ